MIKVVADQTGFAPADMQWMAYDDDRYDGAPDAGPQIIGYGSTGDEAVAAYYAEQKMFDSDMSDRMDLMHKPREY